MHDKMKQKNFFKEYINMDNTLSVAKYVLMAYKNKFHKELDEITLHRLMYFIQKESLIIYKDILFDEYFYAYNCGPILKSIQKEFHNDLPLLNVQEDISDEAKRIIDEVLNISYIDSTWTIYCKAIHEFCYIFSRRGLTNQDIIGPRYTYRAMKVDIIKEMSNRRKSKMK